MAQIQHMTFSDGSFILHAVMIGERKFSAWFHKDGTMSDAELIRENRSTADIKRDSPTWNELQTIGRRYATATTSKN